MLYLIVLVALLVVLAGVIAYAGDVLGAYIGRKRLSLFGWRPKRTGRVVGIVGGIVIMLVTLGTLALAFRGATNTLIRAQETIGFLRAQQVALEHEVASLQEAVRLRTSELASAQAERSEALAERDALLREIDELGAALAEAQTALREAEAELAQVEDELSRARSEREAAIAELSREILQAAEAREAARQAEQEAERLRAEVEGVQAQLDALRASAAALAEENRVLEASNQELQSENERLLTNNTWLVQQNDELLVSIVEANDRIVALNDQINELQARVDRQARELTAVQREFASMNPGTVAYRAGEIVHHGVISAQEPTGIRAQLQELLLEANRKALERGVGEVELTSVQVSSLEEAILESSGEDIVVLYSPVNQFGGSRLRVEIDAFENTRLLVEGQLVVSRQFHLGTTEDLLGELSRLNAEAANRLQRLGLFEGERPRRTPDTLSEEGFAAQLMRLDGPVVVGLMASEAVYRSGPAHLEFVIVH
jgi:uncharacterized protein (DUF3084 family)